MPFKEVIDCAVHNEIVDLTKDLAYLIIKLKIDLTNKTNGWL